MKNPKEGRTRIPKSKSTVYYHRNPDGYIVSNITFDCGCEVDIEWVKSGQVKSTNFIGFCDEHDPTTKDDGKSTPFHFQ